MKYSSKLLPLAIVPAMVLSVTLSGNAYGAYAESYNNFVGAIVFEDEEGNPLTPPDILIVNTVPLSSAEARLNGAGELQGGIGFLDSPPANAPGSNPTRANNAFDSKGPLDTEYSGADAWIPVRQTGPQTPESVQRCIDLGFGPPPSVGTNSCSEVVSIAEDNVTEDGHGADSDSQNSSITTFSISVPARVRFRFIADPYMRVKLGPLEGVGSVAFSEISTVATITPDNGGGFFEWSPNGDCAGGVGDCTISGGMEIDDPVSLNTDLTTTIRSSDFVFPAGLTPADAPDGDTTTGNFIIYEAVSDLLGPGDYSLNIAQETDVGVLTAIEVPPGACRMTGGNATISPAIGIDGVETWTFGFDGTHKEDYETGFWITTGGQINAPSGNQPPSGHWTHTQHGGAEGGFTFHAGTSSAPDGTQISTVECADPGWCVQARCAPFKQLFWTGIGNFANQHFDAVFPGCDVVKGQRGTQHFVRTMIGDFGENDRPTREESLVDGNPDSCDWQERLQAAGYPGFPGPYTAAEAVFLDSAPDDKFFAKDGQVCDKCPDYYQIEIHCNTDPGSDVIYTFEGFLDSGNYQIHPVTGSQCPASDPELVEFSETSGGKGQGKGKKK